MDFSLTEDQQAISELAQKIFSEKATDERIKALAQDPHWYDDALWEEIVKAGLVGAGIGTDSGGGGFGLLELAGIFEEMGRCIAPVPLLSTVVLGALPIDAFGSEAQKKELLPGVVEGRTLLTAALGELGHIDPSRPATTARRGGSGWILDGRKVCVPDANRSARILVPARTEDGTTAVFLVAPDQPGVRAEREATSNGEPQFTLHLAGVEVSPDWVLGDPARGAEIVSWIEHRATVAVSALQLGIADEALRRTAAYATERKQFGQPIGSFQAVAMRAADAYIDVEAIRSTLYQAIWAIEEERDTDKAVAVAKWWACRAGHRVAHSAQHLHGGTGADVEYPIHRFFLWAKQTEYTLGGASPHLARLGAMLADGEAA
jgi:alkylation response protein AidB-like acyl-CoA dehydrogenase